MSKKNKKITSKYPFIRIIGIEKMTNIRMATTSTQPVGIANPSTRPNATLDVNINSRFNFEPSNQISSGSSYCFLTSKLDKSLKKLKSYSLI